MIPTIVKDIGCHSLIVFAKHFLKNKVFLCFKYDNWMVKFMDSKVGLWRINILLYHQNLPVVGWQNKLLNIFCLAYIKNGFLLSHLVHTSENFIKTHTGLGNLQGPHVSQPRCIHMFCWTFLNQICHCLLSKKLWRVFQSHIIVLVVTASNPAWGFIYLKDKI